MFIFSCEKKLSITTCQCDLNKKPTLKNTGKEKRNVYSRIYNSQTKHTIYNTLQLEKLEEANKIYSYNIDFSFKFNFSLCVICHNIMTRLKRKSLKDTRTTPLKTSKSNSKGNLKLNGKSKISDKSNVIKEVCEILSDNDDDEIYENKIEISEELNKENIMDDPFEDTVVTDEETDTEIDNDLDVKEFKETLSEISFKLIIKQERESSAAAISQTTFKDFRKKLNLLVQNQLDKWVRYDDYIVSYKLGKETGSGIQLTDERDWIRFLTEYNKFHSKKKELNNKPPTPPTPQPQSFFYPISFPFYNYPSTQSQPILTSQSSTIFPSSGSKPIPTIQEFLENLDNTYGSQKFTCFLERIVSESIDILDIQILTDSDFEKLGISSIGVKTKLVREAKNYSSS
ncbi:hypothetical protein GLOIN_2v1764044 [Rhizophagus irregularis DAOM 181602=DAOM 197198]|uniref:SAM domain-containing protein n=1 Tax=Rhizophagus irregularis (strain DAOM 181602 / DAOM 197198 / MUCL 43194) TaxID=747089 RepID=A0A2P4QT19_RHIID|nr:hypothetical protein GLOIN_2v1764044 [Rhizophagus irregularis DAOM 181602=DAOM 197198]POG80797.1 hypothetical protein GLOIN_2v1764044 [Rhizophagus irregularis DAOM 181602=DAOM 197198]|eukprot:XP_025187663.1 hypothetical protein GLOIN_2v1764044 [Rhizophagus irregularis DAOM 181602=DAOM 197198]